MTSENKPKRVQRLAIVLPISIAVILVTTFAIITPTEEKSLATAISQRQPIPFKLYVDAPLNGPDGAVQIITVERGSSTTVPVKIQAGNSVGSVPVPIKLQVVPDAKLDEQFQPISAEEYSLPAGVSVSFIKTDLEVKNGVSHAVDLTFTVSSGAETGIFLEKIVGVTPQGQHIGTIIYLQVK